MCSPLHQSTGRHPTVLPWPAPLRACLPGQQQDRSVPPGLPHHPRLHWAPYLWSMQGLAPATTSPADGVLPRAPFLQDPQQSPGQSDLSEPYKAHSHYPWT